MLSNYTKVNNNDIKFEINNNNIHTSLVNGLRRIMISEINTIALCVDSFICTQNTTTVNNSMLKQRLNLLPLNNYVVNKDNMNNYLISLDFENKNDTIKTIYASDLKIQDLEVNKELSSTKFFSYPGMILTKIKPLNKLNFNIKCDLNNLMNAGPGYCPTCTAFYSFLNESNLDNPLDRERDYLKLENNEPKGYILNIESVGNYSSNDIFIKAVDLCKKKLEFFDDLIKTNQINVKNGEVKFDSFDYHFDNENDTLGNLLSSYINKNNNVKYCGYYIPHPNEKVFVLRLSLNDNNTLENCNKLITKTIEVLYKLLDKIKDEFQSISQ